jgi:hypothetical protein
MKRVPIGLDKLWLEELIKFEKDVMRMHRACKYMYEVRKCRERIKMFELALCTPDEKGIHWVRLPFQYLVNRTKNIASNIRILKSIQKGNKASSDESIKWYRQERQLIARARHICHAINESGVYMYWHMLSFNDPNDPWWM